MNLKIGNGGLHANLLHTSPVQHQQPKNIEGRLQILVSKIFKTIFKLNWPIETGYGSCES